MHILPYWEKVPIDNFNEFVLNRYEYMRTLFPTTTIKIGETGWPSQGYNNNKALPNIKNQAMAIRGFINLAKEHNLNYNIIEAFDQPWKGYEEEMWVNTGVFLIPIENSNLT